VAKRFEFDPNACYPDYGCNNEVYVNRNLLEIETLGPFSKLPDGGSAEHTEHWFLATLEKSTYYNSESTIDSLILPLENSLKNN
jgi:hypothetical protein